MAFETRTKTTVMIHVEEIDLELTFPQDGIGVVCMQPYIELSNTEPYHCLTKNKPAQLDRIRRTLEIAKRSPHGCDQTHLTIIPEYSVPSLDGVALIQEIVEQADWPGNSLLVAGVDGLDYQSFSHLCCLGSTHIHRENNPARMDTNKWINCCVVWKKGAAGNPLRWVQPKLSAAWPEKQITHSEMQCGKAIYIFRGKFSSGVPWRLIPLICFDWVGRIGSDAGVKAILSAINEHWESFGRKEEITLLLILQRNAEPNHPDFLENSWNYFNLRRDYPFVGRDDGITIFANNAGGPTPGRYKQYGNSGLIYSPNAPYMIDGCPPTFSVNTKKLRNSKNLRRCKEALFRESGASIHTFRLLFPASANLGPGEKSWPIEKACVFPLEEPNNDPRTPGGVVPASVKWINDELDKATHFLASRSWHPLRQRIEEAHSQIASSFRIQSHKRLGRFIELGTVHDKPPGHGYTVDDWHEPEQRTFKRTLHLLSILNLVASVDIDRSPAHATITFGANVIDVLMGTGSSHHSCLKYCLGKFTLTENRLTVIITDDDETPLSDKEKTVSFLDVPVDTLDGGKIEDPNTRLHHIGYKNILNCFINSKTVDEMENGVLSLITN